MARIYIEPSRVKRTAQDELDLSRVLNALAQEVDSIRSNMRYKITGRAQIAERLRQVSEQIVAEAGAARNMGNGLQQIVAWYEKTENSNRDSQVAEKTKVRKDTETESVDWWEILKKLIKPALGPYALLTTLPDILNDKPGSFVKYLFEAIEGGSKIFAAKGDTTVEWLRDLFKISTNTKTWDETFLDKLGQFDSVPHAVGTVANWATKLIDSFVKNTEEFGGEWCARFWEETVTEAGIKVLEGAAVTAGVVAVIGGASGIVIGVAAAGATLLVDWGLDSLVSWATGGSETSWIEYVSDRVCDNIDALRETVGPTVEKAGQVISDGIDAVVDTGRKVVDSVKDGISNIFSGKWFPSLAN